MSGGQHHLGVIAATDSAGQLSCCRPGRCSRVTDTPQQHGQQSVAQQHLAFVLEATCASERPPCQCGQETWVKNEQGSAFDALPYIAALTSSIYVYDTDCSVRTKGSRLLPLVQQRRVALRMLCCDCWVIMVS